jgi:hypothetical protein
MAAPAAALTVQSAFESTFLNATKPSVCLLIVYVLVMHENAPIGL